jgi:putative hydrolase of the HAD superfamily
MQKYKAIVFDLDGTLVDQEGAERDALLKLYENELKALDPAPSFRDFLRVWRTAADDYLQRFLDNKMSFEDQRVRRFEALFTAFNQACPPGEAKRLHEAYVALYRKEWRAFDEAKPALAALKAEGYRLAVITNGDGAQQKAKLVATDLLSYFEDVTVSGDFKVAKPDPGIFRQSEKALGLAAAELVYVGDRLDVDVAGAKNASWTPVWLDRKSMPGGPGEAGVLVAQDLSQLSGLLKA